MTQLPRVYFDTNEGHEAGYLLILDQSVRDLAALGERLRDGLRVIIYMTGELEMEAHLRFDRASTVRRPDEPEGAWIAEPIEGTIRDLSPGAGPP